MSKLHDLILAGVAQAVRQQEEPEPQPHPLPEQDHAGLYRRVPPPEGRQRIGGRGDSGGQV